MNTATTYTPLPGADRRLGKQGWAGRFWNRLMTARQREAERRIARHLRMFDDATLQGFNLDAAALARLRKGGTLTGA